MLEHAPTVAVVALFVVSAVGGLIVYELRRLHDRIDKYAARMESHIDQGVQVHTAVTEVRTELRAHVRDLHKH